MDGIIDNSPLSITRVFAIKSKRESDPLHDYGGNGTHGRSGVDEWPEGQVPSATRPRYTGDI